jgi:excisionase family DNA binding protein
VRSRGNGSSQPKGAADDLAPLAVLHADAAPALDLLTAPQVMARLQLGRSAVYDLLRTGQLASITLGRARRIPTRNLADFIRARLEQEAV